MSSGFPRGHLVSIPLRKVPPIRHERSHRIVRKAFPVDEIEKGFDLIFEQLEEMNRGRKDRAAAGLKQAGPLALGFQNTGSSKLAVHPRRTMQTNPFLPRTAIS